MRAYAHSRLMGCGQFYDDPQYWRERGDEARTTARFLSDMRANDAMLRVAVEYDQIAHLTEQRLAQQTGSKPDNVPCRGYI
jgi:hypothetical protein